MSIFPIISNCNFESRDDAEGKAIHAARKAAESGQCGDVQLLAALNVLEAVLDAHSSDESEPGKLACGQAEAGVVAAWHAAEVEA